MIICPYFLVWQQYASVDDRVCFDSDLGSHGGAVLSPSPQEGATVPPNRKHHSKKHVGRTGRRNVLPDVKPRLLVSMHWRASAVYPWLCAPPGCLPLLLLLLWLRGLDLFLGAAGGYKHSRHECGGSRCSVRSAVRPGSAGAERGSGGDADGHSVPGSRSARRRRGAD